ncbi:prepilin-type N-terminal cleavage/methylation domain-containing protein [Elusimicrobium simillimum]|uniref:type IV pilin protein n=1 Tax=Elusimicrobium simillimum TaxID=3143438 RepID=UPI003C6FEA5E
MKKGFTLIELLVVVLIIGILAAIALPQYTKAVEKSRVTEALSNLKTIRDNSQMYVMAHGFPNPQLLDQDFANAVDIELTGGSWDSEGYYVTKNFKYQMGCFATGCESWALRAGDKYVLVSLISSSGEIDNACYDYEDPAGVAICKQLVANGYRHEEGTY